MSSRRSTSSRRTPYAIPDAPLIPTTSGGETVISEKILQTTDSPPWIKRKSDKIAQQRRETLYRSGRRGYTDGVVSPDQEGPVMGRDARLDALRNRHTELDTILATESAKPQPDTSLIATLKRQKLAIKDEMVRMSAPA